jgi:putative membrane protein
MSTEPDPRVILAAERTLLAWIRTGLALMGLGFVVARFGVFLRELASAEGHAGPGGSHSPIMGVALVLAGVGINAWSSLRHRRLLQDLREGRDHIDGGASTGFGAATAIGGLVLVYLLVDAMLR